MKPKTYRVNAELAKEACERMIEYIAENREAVTEAQIINAAIEKGLKEITHKEIAEFIERNN